MNTQNNSSVVRSSHYKVKMIAVCAMLLAIGAILDSYAKIPLMGGFLQVKFTFISFAISGMLFGPWIGLGFGFALDTLSCIFQSGFAGLGGWMPEWALVNIIKGFLFGLLLYNAAFNTNYSSKIPTWKIILTKYVDTILINIGLNSFLTYFVSKWVPFSWAHFGTRVGKNLILLPFECVILFFVIRFCEKNRKLLK